MRSIIKQVNRYEIAIGERIYRDFAKKDEWNGFIKFQSTTSEVIVSKKELGFANLFDEIFGEIFNSTSEKEDEYVVVKVSSDIYNDISNKKTNTA